MSKTSTDIILLALFLALSKTTFAQTGLTLGEVVSLAKEHSLEYRENKNRFLSDYFAYRQFKLSLLPKVNFNATPFTVNRSLTERYDFENNIETFRESRTLSSNSGINISQKIPVTGGNLSVGSNFSRIENFGESHLTSYSTTPFRISLSQPLFAHNPYRWEKRELPLKLKLAKLRLLQSEQDMNLQAARLYFNLLKAFQLFELALQEVSNSDTLLNAGKTLLAIKTITPSEMVELELKSTNARVTLAQKGQELTDARYELNQLLRGGLPGEKQPVLMETLPVPELDAGETLKLARDFNPFYIEIEQEKINLQKSIDQAEKQNRFSASLNLSYGLNQGGKTIREALDKPLNQQTGSLSLSFPLLNWGENKDNLLLARIDMEMAELKIENKITDFEQELLRKTTEYNLTMEMIKNTGRAKELATETYHTKIQQYKMGQVTLQELNQAQVELLRARENHIESITRFWLNYYELQKITLHDLITAQPLDADFDRLINIFNR